MRYWVISCSILMGGTSLIRPGDPGRVIASVEMGAGIGVILYVLYVALKSAVS